MVTPPDQGGNEGLYDPEFAATAFAAGLQPDLTVAAGTDVAALYDAAFAANPEGMQRVMARGDDGTYRFVNVAVSTQGGEAGAVELADGLKADFEPCRRSPG